MNYRFPDVLADNEGPDDFKTRAARDYRAQRERAERRGGSISGADRYALSAKPSPPRFRVHHAEVSAARLRACADLPLKGIAMIYAARGIGKTHVALGAAYAAATGTAFLRWQAPVPRKVFYIDGEMPCQTLQERLAAIVEGTGEIPPTFDNHFRILPMDGQGLGTVINLAEASHQEAIESLLEGAELLVLDNLSTLVNGGRENDAESWITMQGWLLRLRRRGMSVLLIHHAGRSENARGTSKREDILDTVIHLRRPNDYRVEEGARFCPPSALTRQNGGIEEGAGESAGRAGCEGDPAGHPQAVFG